MTFLLWHKHEPNMILRPFGTILIIVAAVFLVVAGYTEEQIAPVIGLLGTIAGYILGRSDRPLAASAAQGSQPVKSS